MVKRILNVLHREISGLHQAAYLLGAFSVMSTILAFIRDRMFAYFFGASHALDIYYASFRIPDLIFSSVASVVSISVLIPFIIEKMNKGREEEKKFVDNVFTVFFLFIIAFCTVAFFLMPYIAPKFFPTFVGKDRDTLVLMARIILLSPILLGISNFFASITQAYKRFFIYATSPVLYNFGIILGIIFLYPRFGLLGLAYGVVLGAIMHVSIQLPFVIGEGLFPRFWTKIDFQSIRRVLILSIPRTITASSNEIAEFFLISFASVMSVGSISIFNYSYNLQSVPLSIIGVSYSLAAFPALARKITSGDQKEFLNQMIASAKHIIFWSLPAVILFIVLRAQVVRVILGSGQFNWTDTKLTAASLALFVISIIPQSLMPLFVRSYYARGRTRTPLIINFISASFIILFSYGLYRFFNYSPVFSGFITTILRVNGLPGASVLMLPLGFSIGATFNMLVHWIDFQKDYPAFSSPVLRTFFQTLAASLSMGVTSYFFLWVFSFAFNLNTTLGIFMQGFLAGIIGIFVYVAALKLLGNPELSEVADSFRHKFWKKGAVVIPEQENL